MTGEASSDRYKVGRVLSAYGLERLDERLPVLWTGDGDEQRSLRELAALINRNLLAASLEDAGLSPLEAELDSYLELLTASETSSGERTRVKRELEREGVDVETLVDDFVTHQAVHTYLRNHHEVERESSSRDPVSRLQRLRGRVQAVAADTVQSARAEGAFEEFTITVGINVICADCGTRLDVTEVLRGAECDCPGQG